MSRYRISRSTRITRHETPSTADPSFRPTGDRKVCVLEQGATGTHLKALTAGDEMRDQATVLRVDGCSAADMTSATGLWRFALKSTVSSRSWSQEARLPGPTSSPRGEQQAGFVLESLIAQARLFLERIFFPSIDSRVECGRVWQAGR